MDETLKLHVLQMEILKKMVTNAGVRFNDLLIEGLESEHMNYHLKKLLDCGFVTKNKNLYTLSDSGKNYTNLLDDQVEIVERQPKSSVLLHAVRKNEKGEIEHLLSKRLRQPYLGKIGRLTGKIRFGETLEQAASRELYEETGLKAKSFVLEEIHHKLRYRENGSFVQDTLFYCFFTTGFSGSFIEKTSFQENMWLSPKDFKKIAGNNTYDRMELDIRFKPHKLVFTESIALAEGF